MIDFGTLDITEEESTLVTEIVKRAAEWLESNGLPFDCLSARMDLEACHGLFRRLDFAAMLDGSIGDMMYDIVGIRTYLNRETGELLADFEPRFAA